MLGAAGVTLLFVSRIAREGKREVRLSFFFWSAQQRLISPTLFSRISGITATIYVLFHRQQLLTIPGAIKFVPSTLCQPIWLRSGSMLSPVALQSLLRRPKPISQYTFDILLETLAASGVTSGRALRSNS